MDDKMMGDDMDVENVGIMQGFLDSMDESEEDDEEYGGDDYATVDRRPDSPEILMNNLRGDMRSIDARRDELADLVGYAAAAETPESVLAMLQPVLAGQGPAGAAGAGIGGLAPSMDMAQGPQPPMAAAPMPPGAPGAPGAEMAPPPADGGIAALLGGAGAAPGGQPPVGMARGGYVQNFANGSEEEGVTPVDGDPSEKDTGLGFKPTPEMVELAKKNMLGMFQQKAAPVPNLAKLAGEQTQVYKDILGDRGDLTQAQMLMALGQRAFGFAGNVDDQGRPLRGSFLSRLAGATRTLPSEMSQYIGQIDKEQRQLKLMGVQAAEKIIGKTKDENLKLLEVQRKGWADILKAASKEGTGTWGNSLTGKILGMFNNLAPNFAAGKTSPEEDSNFLTAVRHYTQPTQIEYTDPRTGEKSMRTQQNQLPDFVVSALNARKIKIPTGTTVMSAPPAVAAQEDAPVKPMQGQDINALPQDVQTKVATAPNATFFDLSRSGTGFVPVLVSGVTKLLPFDAAGAIAPEFQQSTTALTNMVAGVVQRLQTSPHFAQGERKQILSDIDLRPALLQNRQSYLNSLVALDQMFASRYQNDIAQANDKLIGMEARKKASGRANEFAYIRKQLGVQDRLVNNTEDWMKRPPGEYFVFNPATASYVFRAKE